jgi:tRNA (adenine22-N1)-methyltransferase
MGRPLSLKPRLLAIASRLPAGSRVADIGTDHARLPVYIAQRGLVRSVVAVENRPGPLAAAAATIAAHKQGGRVELRHGSGAELLSPDETDCAVIAGMGGGTIVSIIEGSPWLLGKKLFLQPQTHARSVEALLEQHGVPYERAEATEGRRRYTIIITTPP